MRTEIIFEDDHMLVCRKPAGLPVQTAKVSAEDMVSELKNYLPEGAYLGVIHRLDQPVEGLLVFAKSKKAARILNEQFRDNSFLKTYYAVAFNQPLVEEGLLEDYMIKDGSMAKIVDAKEPGAKKAVLRYRLLGAKKGRVLYEIHLVTGRFHQIRAQMAHAGMPLLGDKKYASDGIKIYSEVHDIHNVALCACEIKCNHPISGKSLSFVIEPEGEVFRDFFEK